MKIALFFEVSLKDVLYFNATTQNIYTALYDYWEDLSDFNKSIQAMTDINGEKITEKDLNISHHTYIRLLTYLSNFENLIKYVMFDFENIMPFAVKTDTICYKVIGEIDFEEVIEDMLERI